VIACTPWPCDVLATSLPVDLELAPQVTSRGVHPVLFVFGEQRVPAVLRAGLAIPMGAPYGEFGVVVPYVRARGGTLLYTYVWHMHSTYFPAVWEGNTRYFSKATGNMRWHDGGFVMTSEERMPLFDALVAPCAEWRRTETDRNEHVELGPLRDAVELPIVGRPGATRLAVSRFGWDFDAAHVRPVRVVMTLTAALFGDGVSRELTAGPEDALAIRDMTWQLGWPMPWVADRPSIAS
jgi:hypothetical protein